MAWEGSDALRAALKGRGRKTEFAAAMGVNPSQVSRWIRGAQPDEELWPQIEKAAGITLERTNWRDEAARLQEQVDELRAAVLRHGEQLAALAKAQASAESHPPAAKSR